MQHDVIFFIGGVPNELLIRDKHFLIAALQPDLRTGLNKLGDSLADFKRWLTRWPEYSMAVFRYNIAAGDEAFETAYQALSGICDGYSVLKDSVLPSICPIVQLRREREQHASVHIFAMDQGRIWTNSDDDVAKQRWNERRDKLFVRFLPLFDVLGNADVRLASTEIGEQLKLSLKMFRHGCRASNVGIEFLCKFSALEGLVCGSEQYQKERMLKDRLGRLFTMLTSADELIGRLWKLRCEASHQSKAFSERFVQANADVEFLITGTLSFFVDHLNSVATIDELWKKTNAYKLPPEAILQPDVLQGRVVKSWADTGIFSNGIGPIVDAQFGLHGKVTSQN